MKPDGTHRPTETHRSEERDREQRHRRLIELIREWEADESGYDEEIWPLIEKELIEQGDRGEREDGSHAAPLDLLRLLGSLPRTRRTKNQIDASLRDERESWERTP